MKKSFFCVLFALLIVLSSVAAAESTGCCACCSGAGCTSADSTTSSYTPKYGDADYTQEVVYHDFHLFFPSSFENDSDTTFRPDNGNKYPEIMVMFNNDLEIDPLAFYPTQDELRAYYDTLVAENPTNTIIQMDECIGIMRRVQIGGDYYVNLFVLNRKNSIDVTICSNTLDEALELAQGIIDHAVAKEVPLQELEQAE